MIILSISKGVISIGGAGLSGTVSGFSIVNIDAKFVFRISTICLLSWVGTPLSFAMGLMLLFILFFVLMYVRTS